MATNGHTVRHTDEIRLLMFIDIFLFIFLLFGLNTIKYLCVTQISFAGFDIYRKKKTFIATII